MIFFHVRISTFFSNLSMAGIKSCEKGLVVAHITGSRAKNPSTALNAKVVLYRGYLVYFECHKALFFENVGIRPK